MVVEVPAGAVVVVELSDDALLHADAPSPTASTPRTTGSLRTKRGYPRGSAPALALKASRGVRAPSAGSSGSGEPGALADVVRDGQRCRRGGGRGVTHVQDSVAGL